MALSPRIARRTSLCALTLLASALLVRNQVAGKQISGAERVRLYRLNAAATALVPMDPQTLADTKDFPVLQLIPKGSRLSHPLTVSGPDKATLAVLFYPGGTSKTTGATIRIMDARTGRALGSPFHPQVSVDLPGLSTDGSKLYAFRWQEPANHSLMEPATYYVLDARNGHVVRRSRVRVSCCGESVRDDRHLFMLLAREAGYPASRALTPQLVSEDLFTGKELGRLSLPELHAGARATHRQVEGAPLIEGWTPGMALSPDGRQLAIVDGSSRELTLIDTSSMSITKTMLLHQPQGWLARLGTWLQLAPETAYAKGSEGVSLNAQFSPDGRFLYVTGTRGTLTRSNTLRWTQLALEVVDASTGAIVAQRSFRSELDSLAASPDGRSIYAVTGRWAYGGACPCVIHRLDARTLAARAARRVGAYDTDLDLTFVSAPAS